MVARRRLIGAALEIAAFLGLLLLVTVGLPLLAQYLGFERPWLAAVARVGRWILPAVPVVLVLGLVWRWGMVRRRQARFQRRLKSEGQTWLLLPRADAPTIRADRVTLWSRLADAVPAGEHLSWDLAGSSEGIAFSLRATPSVAQTVVTQVMAEWPGVQARAVAGEDDPLALPDAGLSAWWCEIVPHRQEPPVGVEDFDPLLAPLTALARLPVGVRAGIQVLVRDDPQTRLRLSLKAARVTSAPPATYGGKILGKSSEERREGQRLDRRAQRQFWEVRVLVWSVAPTVEQARETARGVAQALTAEFGPLNPLKVGREGQGPPGARDFPIFMGRPWTDEELALVAHLVGGTAREVAPNLRTAPAKPLPPAPASRVHVGTGVSLAAQRLELAVTREGAPG